MIARLSVVNVVQRRMIEIGQGEGLRDGDDIGLVVAEPGREIGEQPGE